MQAFSALRQSKELAYFLKKRGKYSLWQNQLQFGKKEYNYTATVNHLVTF
jgi:hypothetical protein